MVKLVAVDRDGTFWRITAIARNAFREAVRDRVLYNLVFFAVMMIAVSYLLSQLTAGQDIKVIKDLGLAAMSLFGLFIAVFIGIGLVSKEVEKRSIYALLSKPIRRHAAFCQPPAHDMTAQVALALGRLTPRAAVKPLRNEKVVTDVMKATTVNSKVSP